MVVNSSQTLLKPERPPAPILIFDIETVPDIPLLYLNYKDNLNLEYRTRMLKIIKKKKYGFFNQAEANQ